MGLGLRICRKGRLNSEEVKLFFPKPEGIFPNGVNKHSQLSSFIHPSWSKCFLQRWLTHELGLWMKSKHYLWIFQVVLWAGSVCIPFEMEKNCRNHTFSWRNGCVPLTKFTSISPVEVSHEPFERYRFPSCSVTNYHLSVSPLETAFISKVSGISFKLDGCKSVLIYHQLSLFNSQLSHFRTCCFLSKKSPPFWPHSQKKSPVSKCFHPAVMAL